MKTRSKWLILLLQLEHSKTNLFSMVNVSNLTPEERKALKDYDSQFGNMSRKELEGMMYHQHFGKYAASRTEKDIQVRAVADEIAKDIYISSFDDVAKARKKVFSKVHQHFAKNKIEINLDHADTEVANSLYALYKEQNPKLVYRVK